MTDDELQALCDGAVRDDWRVSMSGYSIKSNDPDVPIVAAVHGGAHATPKQMVAWLRNADLIVAAVNAIPAKLAELARVKEQLFVEVELGNRLRAENERLRALLGEARAWRMMGNERPGAVIWSEIDAALREGGE